jgi:hypothetical protein
LMQNLLMATRDQLHVGNQMAFFSQAAIFHWPVYTPNLRSGQAICLDSFLVHTQEQAHTSNQYCNCHLPHLLLGPYRLPFALVKLEHSHSWPMSHV